MIDRRMRRTRKFIFKYIYFIFRNNTILLKYYDIILTIIIHQSNYIYSVLGLITTIFSVIGSFAILVVYDIYEDRCDAEA